MSSSKHLISPFTIANSSSLLSARSTFRAGGAGNGESRKSRRLSLADRVQNNVERVQYYNDLALEAAPTLPTDPGAEWPTKGAVTFENVQLRYRPELPLVLNGLNFSINPGEKVGIIGESPSGTVIYIVAEFAIRSYWSRKE